MMYVPTEVILASVYTRLWKLLYTKPMPTQNCSITQQSSRTELRFRHRVSYSSGWIASPATRDCLSWHWISWRLLPLKPMLNDYSRCVVIWQQEKRNSTKVSLCRRVFLKLNRHILHWMQSQELTVACDCVSSDQIYLSVLLHRDSLNMSSSDEAVSTLTVISCQSNLNFR